MATTNKRLAGPALVSNAAATKYTTPLATTTIIQFLQISNPSTAAVSFTMSIGADATGTRIYDNYSIPSGANIALFIKHVLAAGEIVQAFAGTNNVLTLTLDGQEVT